MTLYILPTATQNEIELVWDAITLKDHSKWYLPDSASTTVDVWREDRSPITQEGVGRPYTNNNKWSKC